MTTCVLACEGCGLRKPFPVGEEELAQLRGGAMVQKHCPGCRALSDWMFTGLDLRVEERRRGEERRGAGAERRIGTERRLPY